MINKNRFLLLVSLLTFHLIYSCTSVKELNYTVIEKKHEPAKLIADVDLTYKLLKEGHPGVYWYINEKELALKFDSLKKTITSPLTTKEFYKKLAPVVAAIKCGHTRIMLVTKIYNKKEKDSIKALGTKPINQFTYKVIDDKLYITSVHREIKNLKNGSEIIAIDYIPTHEILEGIKSNFASDGYNQTFKSAVLNRSFINWYSNMYDSKDTLDFKFKNADSIFEYKIATIKKGIKKDSIQMKIKNKDSLIIKKTLAKKNVKLRYKGSDEFKKPFLDLKFLAIDSSIAYLKVKSFSFPYADFNKFYKESFIAIKKANTKDLIIDLRDNGGGSLTACRNLFSYLVDKDFIYLQDSEMDRRFNPYKYVKGFQNEVKEVAFDLASLIILKKNDHGKYNLKYKGIKPLHASANHYNGKVYVLINGYSFSAAALLAANLQGIKRATFVGQETGGGYNGCVAGQIPMIGLPNSKLKLRMGMYKVIPNTHSETIGRGIFPDIEISPAIDDLLKGKDKELDWVLNNLTKVKTLSSLK